MNGEDVLIIIGNITQEPIVGNTKNGNPSLFFNVAVNHEKVLPDGTRSKNTEFLPAAVFGKRAQGLCSILKKGLCVFVRGHHAMYDKIKLSIVADDVQIISPTREKTAYIQPENPNINFDEAL